MKRLNYLLFIFLISIIIIPSCAKKRSEQSISGTRSYHDFINSNKRFGVESGDVYGDLARDLFNARSVTESITIADLLSNLRFGRIDAILVGHNYMYQLISSGRYTEFEFLWLPEDVFLKESSFVFQSELLRDQYNEWFLHSLRDGSYHRAIDRWLSGTVPRFEDIPVYEFTEENGILRVADTGNYPPLSFLDPHGRPIGFGAELVSLFAIHLGMRPDFTLMPYEDIIPYVASNRADMSAATISIEDRRLPNVFYGDPALTTRAMLIVPHGIRIGLGLHDFIGNNIAVLHSAFTYFLTQNLGGIPVIYNNTSTAIDDVRSGRVLGYMDSLSFLRAILATRGNDIFDVIPIPVEIDRLSIAAIAHDADLVFSFNEFLDEIQESSIYHEMHERWFSIDFNLDMPVPAYLYQSNNNLINSGANVLKVAVSAEAKPFVFIDNSGEFSGYSVELALRYGSYVGQGIEFLDVTFSELIPYVENKIADISIDRLAYREERAKRVHFTNSIYDGQLGVLVLKHSMLSSNIDKDYTSFIGGRIGVSLGSIAESITRNYLRGNPVTFTNYSAGIEDIRRGRIDGYMTDTVSLNLYVGLPENQDLEVFEVPSYIFNLPMGAFSTNQDIINRFNLFLNDLSRRGLLVEIQNRWFSDTTDLDAEIPSLNVVGRNGVLRVATSGEKPPYSFVGSNGRLNGYSIELARLFAANEDMIVRFTEMDFSQLIPFVMAGRAEIGLANVSITEERRRSVIFSDPIWHDTFAVIALKDQVDINTLSTLPTQLTQYVGQRIGVMYGTIFDTFVSDILHCTPIYYDDFDLAVVDFNTGRINGFMLYHEIALMLNAGVPNLFTITELEPPELFFAQNSAIFVNETLLSQFNAFLHEIKVDGTLHSITERWMGETSDLDVEMPYFEDNISNGVLRVATSSRTRPFSYYNNQDDLVGYSIEVVRRFAQSQGLNLVIIHSSLNEIIPFVASGRADIGIDVFQKRDETEVGIHYSDPVYEGTATLITLNRVSEAEPSKLISTINWIKTGIERNFITDNRWRLIVDGFRTTMFISILAHILGSFLACIVSFLSTRKSLIFRGIGTLYYEFIARIPKVVILLITFYIFFARTSFSNVQIAVFAFAMISSVEIANVIKKAFRKINILEIEAAKSLGFSTYRTYVSVIFPQIIKYGIVGYTKSYISVLEATAIVGYIAIQDLTRAGEIIRSRTFDAFFPLLLVSLIYLIVVSVCIFIFKRLSKAINAYHPK